MPLPFLKPDKAVAVIIARLSDKNKIEVEHAEGEAPPALQEAAEALIRAVHLKDAAGVVEALTDAFKELDNQPHEEGEHTEKKENFKKAAKDKKAEAKKESKD